MLLSYLKQWNTFQVILLSLAVAGDENVPAPVRDQLNWRGDFEGAGHLRDTPANHKFLSGFQPVDQVISFEDYVIGKGGPPALEYPHPVYLAIRFIMNRFNDPIVFWTSHRSFLKMNLTRVAALKTRRVFLAFSNPVRHSFLASQYVQPAQETLRVYSTSLYFVF
jgi:hypothetical protein